MDFPKGNAQRKCAAGLLFAALLSSCGPAPVVHRNPLPEGVASRPVGVSIVCVIHGDGNYRYHTPDGRALRADTEVLRQAHAVAERNPDAEVFIFHERPGKRRALFSPRPDGCFFLYRNGRPVVRESYRRDRGAARFAPEVERYHRFRANDSPPMVRVFLYFGHEVPEYGGAGYDASHPERRFTIRDLADGVGAFAGDAGPFDLVVLSTCFGGTPHTIAALSPFARYIIASPENLHLSHFDIRALERLRADSGNAGMAAFARTLAQESFDRLAATVQTVVTVAVYDVARVRGYLDSLGDTLRAPDSGAEPRFPVSEWCDCAETVRWARPGMRDGVEVRYRPARFGRAKLKREHSGWECGK